MTTPAVFLRSDISIFLRIRTNIFRCTSCSFHSHIRETLEILGRTQTAKLNAHSISVLFNVLFVVLFEALAIIREELSCTQTIVKSPSLQPVSELIIVI